MKKLILTSILAVLVASGTTVMAQENPEEYLGLPGDNLNLYAVMKLFQESQTLEEFERNLNNENSKINNLDLNGDGQVDYINVFDFVDGNVHNIVLRAMLGQNETQDVAVFTVQRFNDGSVQIQLVGDDELYGKNYIIEPYYTDNGETPNPGYTGRQAGRVNITIVRTTPYEIAYWPVVRYIYMPDYVVWRSRWYWGFYPDYWSPWRPFYWHYYYGYHYNLYHDYYAHYRHWNNYRYERYNDFYYRGIRSHSQQVAARINEGNYRSTYSNPEQRKEGEALFTSSNANRSSVRPGNEPSAVQRRRTGTAEDTGGQTNARSNQGGNRTATKPSTGQDATSTRRQETYNENRPETKPSSVQNASTPRQTTSATGSRSNSQQNAGASRRSSETVATKPASRTQSSQKQTTVRTSVSQPKSAGSTTSRRSSEKKSSEAKPAKTKDSENSSNTNRR
jgi:hypothetical protein